MASIPVYKSFEEKKNFFTENENFKIGTEKEFDKFYSSIHNQYNSFWRGMGSASHKLYSSLHRFWMKNDLQITALKPANYLKSIITEARNWNDGLLDKYFEGLGLKRKMYDMAILSILRHHGTPVPLLDFTTHPLMGLFFSFYYSDNQSIDNEIDNYVSLYEMTKNHSSRRLIDEALDFKKDFIKSCKQYLKLTSQVQFESKLNQHIMEEMLRYYDEESSDSILVIKDDPSDSILYFINSNLNISKQKGLFILHLNIKKSLEESMLNFIHSAKYSYKTFPWNWPQLTENELDLMTKENIKNHFENFKCYNIHKSLKNYALARLREDGVKEEEIYPDLNKLASAVLNSFLQSQ